VECGSIYPNPMVAGLNFQTCARLQGCVKKDRENRIRRAMAKTDASAHHDAGK
jgi:hypothetical protein